MPERLHRLSQIFERAPIYFVTCCTTQRRSLLANQHVHDTFVSFASSGEPHGAFIGRYVIMPDHLHAFVSVDGGTMTLSRWMKALKGSISRSLRQSESKPPFWQKGFFDHVLRGRDSYEEKWHYVRNNPVRTKLVSEWSQWPFAGEIFDLQFVRDRF